MEKVVQCYYEDRLCFHAYCKKYRTIEAPYAHGIPEVDGKKAESFLDRSQFYMARWAVPVQNLDEAIVWNKAPVDNS